MLEARYKCDTCESRFSRYFEASEIEKRKVTCTDCGGRGVLVETFDASGHQPWHIGPFYAWDIGLWALIAIIAGLSTCK
jgi:DNA-directed RNA polymerase subunit RPC12/RpoP